MPQGGTVFLKVQVVLQNNGYHRHIILPKRLSHSKMVFIVILRYKTTILAKRSPKTYRVKILRWSIDSKNFTQIEPRVSETVMPCGGAFFFKGAGSPTNKRLT